MHTGVSCNHPGAQPRASGWSYAGWLHDNTWAHTIFSGSFSGGGGGKHYLHDWVNKQLLQVILNYMQASQAAYIERNAECVSLFWDICVPMRQQVPRSMQPCLVYFTVISYSWPLIRRINRRRSDDEHVRVVREALPVQSAGNIYCCSVCV